MAQARHWEDSRSADPALSMESGWRLGLHDTSARTQEHGTVLAELLLLGPEEHSRRQVQLTQPRCKRGFFSHSQLTEEETDSEGESGTSASLSWAFSFVPRVTWYLFVNPLFCRHLAL